MRYKYNQQNLINTFRNLSFWIENLDPKQEKEVINATWERVLVLMECTQEEFKGIFDVFGGEGFEKSIMDKK